MALHRHQSPSYLDSLASDHSRPSSTPSHHDRNAIVFRIPHISTPKELVELLQSQLGSATIVGCRFLRKRNTEIFNGCAIVEFKTQEAATRACQLAQYGHFCFRGSKLVMQLTKKVIKRERSQEDVTKIEGATLHMGCLVSPDVLHKLWTRYDVRIELDNHRRLFRILVTAAGKRYKLEWRLGDIYQLNTCRLKERPIGRALLLKVWLAPRVFEQLPITADYFQVNAYEFFCESTEEEVWARTTDFSPQASLGQSFTVCLEIPQEQWRSLDRFPPLEKALSIIQGFSYNTSQMILAPILNSPYLNKLPFELIFLVNSLVQHGYLSGPSLGKTFFQLIQPSKEMPLNEVSYLLNLLKRRSDTCYEPDKWFSSKARQFKKKKHYVKLSNNWLDEGLVWIHRIYITPCRVYCMGPEMDVSNRVTRHFINNIENFLRVTFVEEDFDNLPSNALMVPKSRGPQGSSSQTECTRVYEHILSVLNNGITIGNKRFEFLAFSSSQLRESSVWLFSSDQRISADSIRDWMGDFLEIRNVAKCAARMGQSFSSSTQSFNVHQDEVDKNICDIWDRTSTYCFSDGIGKISESFACEVAKKCKFRRLYGRVPSSYQIRYGGYKGVVAVDPNSNYKLSLRPSMDKFPSTQIGLDILNWSHPIPSYLNRQIINLLSTLGVPDVVFKKMQMVMMQRLDNMMEDVEVTVEVLQMFCAGDSHRVMIEMLSEGYSPSSEPFLMRMMYAFRAVQLMSLRKKTRIFVPKGRILIGCLDETATLNYGEVFVSVSPRPGAPHRIFDDGLTCVAARGVGGIMQDVCIVKGEVIVTKNPCVHPGDVRVLTAVDVPALHHMVDCIVFPQRGDRSHPSECSGSDLDGDLYFVSWDKELIPPEVDQPMDYTPSWPQMQDHPVTIQEIEEHFVKYMVNDSLGVISNAHLVFADAEPEKARDRKCLELAKLCSIAVDFPKTGVAAILPAELRPTRYPDFMEKNDKPTYESERVLGQLYRSVIEKKDDKKINCFTKKEARMVYDKELQFDGFECYLDEAQALKECYDEKLLALMNQYDVKSEAEILTGNILSLSRLYRKRPGEVKERIQRAVSSLRREARSWLKDYEETANDDDTDSEAYSFEELAKASAWYHVTYYPDYVPDAYPDEDSDYGHLLSFPWVVYDKLLKIKRMHKSRMY